MRVVPVSCAILVQAVFLTESKPPGAVVATRVDPGSFAPRPTATLHKSMALRALFARTEILVLRLA